MTLHEIYETLRRRGMPSHEHLRPVGGLLCHNAFDDEYGWQSTTALPDEDTRDLITMHALRWALGRLDSESARASAHLEVFSDGSCAIERGDETLGESDADTLEAILAATAHLEPK